MNPLSKTVKENTGAIAAAFVVLAIVAATIYLSLSRNNATDWTTTTANGLMNLKKLDKT